MSSSPSSQSKASASAQVVGTWSERPRFELLAGLSAWQTGEGDDLVLLHGVGLNADAWGGQVGDLGSVFRLLAIDLPGHGGSRRLPEAAGLADYGDCIAAVIDTLTGPVMLAGHSMGALLAMDVAFRYPEKVRKVVALNAVFQRPAAAQRAVKQRADALSGIDNPDPASTLRRWFGDALDCPEAQACRDWLQSVNPLGYRQAYHVFAYETGPAPDALSALSIPALFMTGSEEPNSTPAMSRAMAELAPGGRVAIIDGAAHMMPMTHATEVSQTMLGFLEEE